MRPLHLTRLWVPSKPVGASARASMSFKKDACPQLSGAVQRQGGCSFTRLASWSMVPVTCRWHTGQKPSANSLPPNMAGSQSQANKGCV